MKTRLATALSVAGVLSAGSAAALVNTQILDGGPVESSASAAILPTTPTVDITIPEFVIDPTVAPSSTTVAPEPVIAQPAVPAAPSPALSADPAPVSVLTAFNIGDAGVVTVDVIDGLVVLVDAQPNPGWTVTDAVQQPAENKVVVQFSSSTVRVNFEATLVDGQIVPSVSSKSIGGTTGTSSSSGQTATAPSSSHDDDEYEHDDIEHESEHESEHDSEHDSERDDD